MKFFVIDENQLVALRRVQRRLHTEDRLNGDEMRDLGHSVQAVADVCEQIPMPEPARVMTCRAGVQGYGGIHNCTTPPKWQHMGNVWCDEHRPCDRFGTPTGERINATPDYNDGVREGLRLAAEKACADLLGLGGTVRKKILELASDVQKDST